MTIEGAAGLIGNLEAESGLYPCRVQGDYTYPFTESEAYARNVMSGAISVYQFAHDAKGFGLAQWTYYSLKQDLLSYCRKTGQFIGDLAPQTDFLIDELRSDYPVVWNQLCTSENARASAVKVMTGFERPADQSQAAQNYRGNLADKWLSWLRENSDSSELPDWATHVAGSEESQRPKTDYWPPRMIDKGMKGQDVAVLQAVLMARGYYTAGIDSDFSEITDEAVKAFQTDYRLSVDGVVGPKTWAELLKM